MALPETVTTTLATSETESAEDVRPMTSTCPVPGAVVVQAIAPPHASAARDER
jgi:hypothetical protein